ncbi:MAG: PDZ domain-containing protein [Calditrichaeota bacterium]|nr:PDZ domain-containing protein [Calditrichota bacterium]MCB9366764.1 PDZ domain-containing protein [Calditrichota bacterium]MCB9391917.1 PDZ domain-containing protein [Calditrichota bacterium]
MICSLAWAVDSPIQVSASPSGKGGVLVKDSKRADDGAFLGIVPEEVTSDIATDYGVKTGQGVLVESVVDGSPAAEAGLRSNDILLSLGGQNLTGPSELKVQLGKYKKGDEVALVYKRGGSDRTATATLAGKGDDRGDFEWFSFGEEGPMPQVLHKGLKSRGTMAFAGVVTQELSDGLKKYFNVEGGALISEVVEKSPADKAGLKAGDIVVKIGKEDVEDEGDVSQAIRQSKPDETIDFHVIREGKAMIIPVTLTNRKDFYGVAPDADGQIWSFNFGDEDADQLALEMERLQEELDGLGVELEQVPQIDMDLRIDPDGPRIFISDGDARAISAHENWWNWNLRDLRTKLQIGLEELKKDMQTLKGELERLKIELRERMSDIWSPVIEVITQA